MTTTIAKAAMRDKYGEVLVKLGEENPNVVFVGGDLNKSVMSVAFGKKFPERFFDFGAAEANMMNVAAGLAASGKIPFVSTFAVFATGNAFEQIRVGIAQSNLNVKIVVTHAGIMTGEDGISAQSIEDLALMCSFPTFNVIVPADVIETEQAVRTAANTFGPFYIRLVRPATKIVLPQNYQFRLGKAATLREGKDLTIIACGVLVPAALDAAESLAKAGIQARVLNMASLRPFDEEAVIAAAKDTGAIVTAEEHLKHGGLGAAVARVVAEKRLAPVEMVALPDGYCESGTPDELLVKYHLTPADIEAAAKRALTRKKA